VSGSVRLTKTTVNYSIVNINNRDSRLISQKISLRSSFPFHKFYLSPARKRTAKCLSRITIGK